MERIAQEKQGRKEYYLNKISEQTDTGYINVAKLFEKLLKLEIIDTAEYILLMFIVSMDFKEGGIFLIALEESSIEDFLINSIKEDPTMWINKFEEFMIKRKSFLLPAEICKRMEDIYQTRNKQPKMILASLGYMAAHMHFQ